MVRLGWYFTYWFKNFERQIHRYAGRSDRPAGSAAVGRQNMAIKIVFFGRPSRPGKLGKKIVQNSNDGQWLRVSGDMCPKPMGRTVLPHRPAKHPQKRRFLAIFATFEGGCRPNGRIIRLQPPSCWTGLGWTIKKLQYTWLRHAHT